MHTRACMGRTAREAHVACNRSKSDVNERRLKTLCRTTIWAHKKNMNILLLLQQHCVCVCAAGSVERKREILQQISLSTGEKICLFNLSKAFIFMRLWSGLSVSLSLAHSPFSALCHSACAPAICSSFCLSNCGQCFKQNVGNLPYVYE